MTVTEITCPVVTERGVGTPEVEIMVDVNGPKLTAPVKPTALASHAFVAFVACAKLTPDPAKR